MVVDSDYLELAIALGVVFFLVSLVVSGVNESIQWALRVRAKYLWTYLAELIDVDRAASTDGRDRSQRARLPHGFAEVLRFPRMGDADPRPTNGVRRGGSTALLDGIAASLEPIDAPSRRWRDGKRRTTIKHIPPSSLAAAFLDAFAETSSTKLTGLVRALGTALTGDGDPGAAAASLGDQLADMTGRDRPTVSGALQAWAIADDANAEARARSFGATLSSENGEEAAKLSAALAEFRAGTADDVDAASGAFVVALTAAIPELTTRGGIEAAIASLEGSPIGTPLRRMWIEASTEMDRFRHGLEQWLDGELSRLGGYYKRSVRWILLIIAVVVAVVLNIDSIRLTGDLWDNPAGREALVAQADDLISADPAAPDASEPGPAGLEAIVSACETAARANGTPAPDNVSGWAEELADVRGCVTGAIDELDSLDLIGDALFADAEAWWDDWAPERSSRYLWHLLGVGLTAAALTLGSQFWFDLLRRLVGARRGPIGDT